MAQQDMLGPLLRVLAQVPEARLNLFMEAAAILAADDARGNAVAYRLRQTLDMFYAEEAKNFASGTNGRGVLGVQT